MKKIEIKSSALEALEKIKEAEDQARIIIADAKEGVSPKIIQEAQNEARTIKEKSVKEARAKAQKIRAELIKKAEEDAAQVRVETQQETKILRKKGSDAQSDAVKRVSDEMKKYLKGGVL